jgi:hypothetical protein
LSKFRATNTATDLVLLTQSKQIEDNWPSRRKMKFVMFEMAWFGFNGAKER